MVCCFKGMWVHPYTITPVKSAPDFGIQVHLCCENDAITSCLRLISTSDHFTHPYYAYRKCLSHWYAVSRAYGRTLIPLHQPSRPQIWGLMVTWVEMMSLCHGWGLSTSDHYFIHPYLTYTKGLSNCYAVSRAYGCTHTVTPAKLAPDLGSQGHLRSWNDTTTSWMRLMSPSNCFMRSY